LRQNPPSVTRVTTVSVNLPAIQEAPHAPMAALILTAVALRRVKRLSYRPMR